MFEGLISKRKNSPEKEALKLRKPAIKQVDGISDTVLLLGSFVLFVIGASAIAYEYVAISDVPKLQQTTVPAIQASPTPVPALVAGLSAPSAAAVTAVEIKSGKPLSLKDMQIYDESLALINQFDGNGNQLETAYNMLVDLAKRNPQSGYPYAALADLKYSLVGMGVGSYSDAYTVAQKAIELDPNIADAYVVVAKVLIEQQEFLYAREAANKAIALAPNKPEAMFAMARTTEKWAEGSVNDSAANRAKFGEPEELWGESERWYRKAIDTYQDNIRRSNIYFWLGNMLSNKTPEDVAGAMEAFTKSAELHNDSPWLLNDVGVFLMGKTYHYDQAIAYFEQALKIKDFENARINLGLAEYYKWGDSQQHPEKYKNAQRKPLSPDVITAKTGVTPEYAFVMGAGGKVEPYASVALLKNGLIKNVDVVPTGTTGTALISAASSNHLELAKLLIAEKANVNFVDKDKSQRTAIFSAVQQRNFDMVKLLIENGARLNLTDVGGFSLATRALVKNRPAGKPPTILSYLLAHGVDPTVPNKYGFTTLDSAVRLNDVEAVRLLVNKYHANVNTYTPGKRSSLLEGANSKEVTKILLKAGANPWVKGMDSVDLVAKMMSPLNEPNPEWSEIKKSAALILEARKHVPKPKDFGEEYQGEWGYPG